MWLQPAFERNKICDIHPWILYEKNVQLQLLKPGSVCIHGKMYWSVNNTGRNTSDCSLLANVGFIFPLRVLSLSLSVLKIIIILCYFRAGLDYQWYWDFPQTLCSHTCTPHYQCPPPDGPLVITDGHMLTHYHHPLSLLGSTLGVGHSTSLVKCIMTYTHR